MAASVERMDALARRPWLAPLGLALIAQALFSFPDARATEQREKKHASR